MRQLTKEEAIEVFNSGIVTVSKELGALQLRQNKLFCDFSVYRESLELAVGHPVWAHQLCDKYAYLSLVKETKDIDTTELESIILNHLNEVSK